MPDALKIDSHWTDVDAAVHDPTAAMISIMIGRRSAMRCANMWSRSIQDEVHLSAEPIARWFVGNWWRLRWEGLPPSGRRSHAWRMAHELPAIGGGFLWPDLTFISDGQALRIEARPTPETSPEMIKYQANFDSSISSSDFENAVDRFVDVVNERLYGTASGSALSSDIALLRDERHDVVIADSRKLEALLGFDHCEAPDTLLSQFHELVPSLGKITVEEIAAVCVDDDANILLDRILALPESPVAMTGQFDDDALAGDLSCGESATERGRTFATNLRARLGIDPAGPVQDHQIERLLGLPRVLSSASPNPSRRSPLALAARKAQTPGFSFVFRRRRATGRRFEAARLLADRMLDRTAAWHVATDADTARQKTQRAFAAEFLAPIQAISEYIRDDFSMDALEGAAEYFDVSSQTVASQLANHGKISRSHPAVPQ